MAVGTESKVLWMEHEQHPIQQLRKGQITGIGLSH